jgi:putative ABC transport system substrate-binding protein
MNRRAFTTLLCGAAVAWPIAARAQQPAMPVIGFLASESPLTFATRIAAFRHGVAEAGYVEGQNVAIEYRWADGHYDRLPDLAADLVRREVTVIATAGGPVVARAAKAATASIPIVFVSGDDPVRHGLVASFNRPGGNVTGAVFFGVGVAVKRVELLHELLPDAGIAGYLVNPSNPEAEWETRDAQVAANALGLKLHILRASRVEDIDGAFTSLTKMQAAALAVATDPFLFTWRERLVAIANRQRMPMIAHAREYVAAGALASYGASIPDAVRQAGVYVGRILKGERPADLPVVQSTRLELVLNLKTANALGITVPPTLLARADEVIE